MKKIENNQKFHAQMTRRELIQYGISSSIALGMFPGMWLSGCGKNSCPNIILITLDTTRADHLSCYGYRRQTSPNLDRLASESVVYTKAIAPSSWTLPSHASLFTGKFTSSHGAQYDPEGPFILTDGIKGPKSWQTIRARGLARNELTMASILKEAGFSTGSVVGGPWMKKIFGLHRGFDFYDDTEISSLNGRSARQVSISAIKWIKTVRDDKFFLFLNYFDAHAPYLPPEDFYKVFLPKGIDPRQKKLTPTETVDVYDSEIFYMDFYIGKFLQWLKESNLYEKTMIIVTADHGELLGEHGKYGHGQHVYEEEIHIPLLIKYPGTEVAPDLSNEYVQLNDIMAIILERLAISMPQDVQAGVPPRIGHPVLSEIYPLPIHCPDGDWRAIYKENLKFIWNSKGNHQLYNLKKDPGETWNLAMVNPELIQNFISDLDQYLATLPTPGPVSAGQELDKSTKDALKSLGYVE